MTTAPKVSVIVPCFNLGQYVEAAVDSVLAQTCQDSEVIVVNDGSTDAGTNAILAGLDRPRTRVLTTENRGLPAARNHAIRHARGRYVCALDADDRLHPEFLARTTAILDSDPSVAFVSTWLECFGLESWIWRQDRCDFPRLLAECVVLTAAPVRREALDVVGGYDEVRFRDGEEDWDLWVSLVEKGFRGTIVPEVLFYYRQRAGSMRRLCARPEVRTRLWRRMLDKHRASYERFLPEVLLLKEEECGRLLRENWGLEHEIETRLRPLIAERRAALERLRADLAAMPAPAAAPAAATRSDADPAPGARAERIAELTALGSALATVRAEIAALRGSLSWRVTAPLRWGFEGWLAVRRLLRGRPPGGC